jgi:hypothetical protein
MQRLRTIRGFVHVLVAAFFLAQLAGAVASPLASAEAFATAASLHADGHAHHHHGNAAHHHGDQGTDRADHCCALHAFFAGVLPPVIAVEISETGSQPLTPHFADSRVGVDLHRLDRPPRPVHVI